MFDLNNKTNGGNGANGANDRKKHNGSNGNHHRTTLEGINSVNLDGSDTIIELRDISKVFKTAAGPFTALKNIDLEIDKGEFISIVGKSGSGKSTLINMLTGIDHPTGGQVIVAQTPIYQLDEGKMAVWRGQHIGIIFQFFQLLPTLTLIENVMIPMDFAQTYPVSERYDRALHLLDKVNMAQDATKFPSAVSGGQQQKVAIARALANDPPILVADEPTGNLDTASASSIYNLFESLVDQGKTILMVTHDNELAGRAPRTITLADGEIVHEERRSDRKPQNGRSHAWQSTPAVIEMDETVVNLK
ncbi:MAG: ABC transporter ATP-binding protein [Anaerolineales bacterium]|nr:ABC transporter ATP-binding protein [Anaerolineales bacterium]